MKAGCGGRMRLLLLSALWLPVVAGAGELWSDETGERRVALDATLKGASLLSYADDDPILFPVRRSAVGAFRARLDLNARPRSWLDLQAAYEHRARVRSEGGSAGVGGAILPAFADAPYRIRQLDWPISEHGERFAYRHEIDRALVALHPEWGEATLGRQAIGLGRGQLFGAVDLFAPFSPTEIDREWRRGVDAARVEYRMTPTTSAEAMWVFGETWEDSAVLGRLRGYAGNMDGELIVGKRAEDTMYAAVFSSVVGEAEAHGEVALFNTRESQRESDLGRGDPLALKAVLGSSYTFDVGNGLTALGEYHYSGFGERDMEDVAGRLASDAAWRERLLRGDMQIVGRHALGARIGYPFNDAWSGALVALGSPKDGSGQVGPSVVWDIAPSLTFTAAGYVPWGKKPRDGRLRSEYGGSPYSLFFQLSLYL